MTVPTCNHDDSGPTALITVTAVTVTAPLSQLARSLASMTVYSHHCASVTGGAICHVVGWSLRKVSDFRGERDRPHIKRCLGQRCGLRNDCSSGMSNLVRPGPARCFYSNTIAAQAVRLSTSHTMKLCTFTTPSRHYRSPFAIQDSPLRVTPGFCRDNLIISYRQGGRLPVSEIASYGIGL